MENGIEEPSHEIDGRLVTLRLDELRPHPAYSRHQLAASTQQISALATAGAATFLDPIVITQDQIIIDGYARWELARKLERKTVLCIECQLTEEEGLQMLLQRHRRSTGLNDFCRIVLALDLEPDLTEKARLNQQFGGQNKGSSNLTQVTKVDVRSEIARIAGVSVGNVTKVKQLTSTAHSNIIKALRENEISIHRAWLWSKLPPGHQDAELWQHQSRKGVRKAIRDLISRHEIRTAPVASRCDLTALLVTIQSGNAGPVKVVSLRVPGKAILVTEELLRSVEPQKESGLTCATSVR